MREAEALDKLLHSLAALLHIVWAWLFIAVIGAPWWAFIGGSLIVVVWRVWQFWRAR